MGKPDGTWRKVFRARWAAGARHTAAGGGPPASPSRPGTISRVRQAPGRRARPHLTPPRLSPPQGHSKSIQCLTVHRNGGKSYIYSGSHDGHINILRLTELPPGPGRRAGGEAEEVGWRGR